MARTVRRGATKRQDGTGQDRTPRRFDHEALARARTELGLTQEQAAAAVGVDVRTWRRYETGAVNAGGAFAVRNASRRQLLGRIARELGLREDDLLVPVAPRPQPRGHVLQPARRFVGRVAEREALARWLADPRSEARVCCVVARGGEGKTALVEHVLGAVDDRVVWSLYEQPDPWALLAALRDGDADAHLDPVDAALAALSRAPSRVVVLDGLEMVQSDGDDARARGELTDPALRRFLRAAATSRGGARVLITSRHPVADLASWEGRGAHTLSLGPLRAEDGAALLQAAGVRASRAVIDAAVAEHGAHALSLTVLAAARPGARLLREGADDDLDELRRDDPQARRLARMLDAVTARLDALDRDLLARVAVFPRGAPVGVLAALAAQGGTLAGALAGCSAGALVRRLDRLAARGIVFAQRAGERYAAHPFVRDALREAGAAREVHAFARAQCLARLDVRPGVHGAERLDDLAALLEHSLALGAADDAATIFLRSLGGFARLGVLAGDFAVGLRLARSFSPCGDPCALDPALHPALAQTVAYEWGLFASAMGDLVTAERAMAHARSLSRARRDGAAEAVVCRGLAYTAHLAGDGSTAQRFSRAAVAGAESVGDGPGLARAWALRAMVLHGAGALDEAAAAFARADALGDRPAARRALWRSRWHLDAGDARTARVLAGETFASLAGQGWTGHAAEARCVLGAAALAEGDLAAAREAWVAARAVAGRTGEVELLLRAHALGERVLRAEGDTAGSDGLARSAEALRAAHGFATLPP